MQFNLFIACYINQWMLTADIHSSISNQKHKFTTQSDKKCLHALTITISYRMKYEGFAVVHKINKRKSRQKEGHICTGRQYDAKSNRE
jgi:hypothetical protein